MKQRLRRLRKSISLTGAWRARALLSGGGVLVGAAAAVFTYGSEAANTLFHAWRERTPWLPLLLTPVGLALIAYLTRRFFPGSEGSGVPQTVAALRPALDPATRPATGHARRAALLSLRIAFGKLALAILGNACGGSIGRGGVMVQVGACVMYTLCRSARYAPATMGRGAILAGGAAGLAAAFNTPLAGIVFAIEGLGRGFDAKHGGVILVTVALAGVTSLALLGHSHALDAAAMRAAHNAATWGAVALCGILGGLAGGLFSQALLTLSGRLQSYGGRHPCRLALGCGVVVAATGLLSATSPHGSGYTEADAIIAATRFDTVIVGYDPLYPFAKMLATMATYLSGVPCGLFSPTLAIGAGLGADLGQWLPFAPLGVMVLLGMTGYFAGMMQTPMTALVIVLEMTNQQSMVLPIIATALIAGGCSRLVCPRPIFTVLADRFVAAAGAARRPAR